MSVVQSSGQQLKHLRCVAAAMPAAGSAPGAGAARTASPMTRPCRWRLPPPQQLCQGRFATRGAAYHSDSVLTSQRTDSAPACCPAPPGACRAGRHVIAFLDRSPLYLVGFSALGEPPAVLRMQLSLVHGQLVSLLTASALGSLFRRSPGYDLRKLLGGWVGGGGKRGEG